MFKPINSTSTLFTKMACRISTLMLSSSDVSLSVLETESIANNTSGINETIFIYLTDYISNAENVW